jgi:hypothetical protein
MQQVIWIVQFRDKTWVREVDEEGNETIFDSGFLKRKEEFDYIGLKDIVNNITYSVDLSTGKFVLRGQNFDVSKEVDGRIYRLPEDLDYRNGVIQFKCSKPMVLQVGKVLPTTTSPQAFNIGYKVALPPNFCQYKRGSSLVTMTHCQAMITVDADTLAPAISSTWTGKMTTADGKSLELKL